MESKVVEIEPGIRPHAVSVGAEPDAVHACKILIIDDEPPNVQLLERVLQRAGFENFVSTDAREAAALFAGFEPDLVLTDWLMPLVDGCEVIEQLRAQMATDDYLPIVVLTADITAQTRKRALLAGATDFLTKPFDQIEVLLRIRNLLSARLSHLIIQRQNASLEESVRQRTLELERTLAELRQTQQQVIEQERLAALGVMAGGIAHDFNNSLSIIMGFGEMLLRDLPLGLTTENATEPISLILTAAEDAAKTVRRLRDFHRPDEATDQRLRIDLNQIVAQTIALTRPRWQVDSTTPGRAIVVKADTREIPSVTGDAAELREVLTNLIFNAVDAMPAGGTITLGTRQEGGGVALTVSDTGGGMSEEVRYRCLEPFYTTKGEHGTGLGLSMVFGIVLRHRGTIDIKSELGKGTAFTLRLPAADDGGAPCPPLPTWSSRPLRVLVVDDQPILCELVCRHLQDDLHVVETALNGSEALVKFRATDFDLVITDHVMAQMNGEQLALAIKEIDPFVPVILLTGYGADSSAGQGAAEGIDLVLRKPLSRAALRHAFEQVMAGKRA